MPGCDHQRVGKAVADVQRGRMPPFAEAAKSKDRDVCLLRGDADHIERDIPQELINFAILSMPASVTGAPN
ncbi:MAG: hypothetical protein ACJ8AW_05560 [Rhodopila sp.]